MQGFPVIQAQNRRYFVETYLTLQYVSVLLVLLLGWYYFEILQMDTQLLYKKIV